MLSNASGNSRNRKSSKSLWRKLDKNKLSPNSRSNRKVTENSGEIKIQASKSSLSIKKAKSHHSMATPGTGKSVETLKQIGSITSVQKQLSPSHSQIRSTKSMTQMHSSRKDKGKDKVKRNKITPESLTLTPSQLTYSQAETDFDIVSPLSPFFEDHISDNDSFKEEPIEIVKTSKQADPFNPCYFCRDKITLRTWCRILGTFELVLFVSGILLDIFKPTFYFILRYAKREDRTLATCLLLISASSFFSSAVCLVLASVFNGPKLCIFKIILMFVTVVSGLSYLFLSAPQVNSVPIHILCITFIFTNFYAGLCALGLYCQFQVGLYDCKIQMDTEYITFINDNDNEIGDPPPKST